MARNLSEVLAQRGATIAPFEGRSLPARFGGPEQEWRAAREGSAVFDASFRSFVHATGADRVSFLQGMLSNDIKTLSAGHGLHAAFLTQQAKLVSDLRVYAEPDEIILDALRWRVDVLTDGLERFLIADDVELVRSTDDVPLVGVVGPSSRSIVETLFGDASISGEAYGHRRVDWRDATCRVVEVAETGGPGFLISGPSTSAGDLFDALCAAGATPMGMDALNVLRVERGVPWAGVDMDENVLLMEAGLDDAVSFKKGCYLGQEVVERVSARGHVNRKLAGLLLEGTEVAPPGSQVVNGDAEVGWTVSSVRSFALQRPISLAYLRREVLEPGTRVQVSCGGGQRDATVSLLPFPL